MTTETNAVTPETTLTPEQIALINDQLLADADAMNATFVQTPEHTGLDTAETTIH